MKKLNLLVLIFLTAFAGYAQEREILISESFSPYSVGNKIAIAANNAGNYWWTTWSNSPGSTEGGVVATYSGNKCGHLIYGNDQVLLLGDQENGNYDLEFDILVPQGKHGYFNILHHFEGSNSTWAMQCYLHMTNDGQNSTHAPGHGTIHAGSNGTADVACVYDAWMHFRLNVNTDNDVAHYYYTAPGSNEVLICTWQWSLDSFGDEQVGRTIAAMDFFPPDTDAANSEFYLDNFQFTRNGGPTAPHFVITPNSINEILNVDEITATTITVSNTGNSIGDWNGWIDFGHGNGGSQTASLYYHNGEESQGIGSSSAFTREMGIRLPATAYAGAAMGMRIISAEFFISSSYQSTDHNYIFRVYGQGMNNQPGELLAEKTVYSTASGTWITATFNQTVYLTGQEIWVCVQLEQAANEYPMTMDGGDYGEYSDGNWLSTNGNAFSHCYSAGNFGGAWLISVNCQGTLIPATWATINKTYGSLLGGNSEVVTLTLNSIGMAQGSYHSNIIVETNDTNLPHVEIPLTLNVGGSAPTYTITATANPTNAGTVSGGGTYAQGSTCTLHATANSGYSFVKWTKNGTQVSTNPNYSFTVTGNAAYVAHFQQNTTNYTITATASPSNAGTITGAGSYASGSTCTLRATPNSGYTFVNWLENGTSVSTNATYSFTVTGNRNLVAVFDVAPTNYTITATANPSNGGSVDGGGTYASGSTCTLRATANSGYTFVNWTKNGTQVSTNPNYSFTVTGNASYVANFEQEPEEYTITVNAEPANGGTVSGGGTYAEGSTCVITAMPNDGYVFENWTLNGAEVSTSPSYSFIVGRSATYVAHFAQNANQATITATAEPVEGGSVSGGGTYELGSNCTLNAVAAVGYEFVNWTLNGSQVSTDASFSFTVTGNAVYVAHFSKIVNHYSVSANVQPANAGSVIGAGTYEEGISCTLIAIANPTYTFVSWTENGAVVSTDEQYTFSVERDRKLVAVFSQGLFYTITASAGGNGSITPEGEVMVNPGEDKTFAIIPNSGCRVSKVLVDGVDVGPVESYTFRSVNANHSIRAQFSGLGVDDNPIHGLKVYPNPANDKINIECPNMKRISVFNLYGVQIEIMDVNDDHAVFSTGDLPQGTYILKVEHDDGIIGYSRFVVVK